MPLVTTAASIIIPKEELPQFFANLEEVEKLCGGREDLQHQIHRIRLSFELGLTEHEPNAVLCSNCGSVFCHVWMSDAEGFFYAHCDHCDHSEDVVPSPEAKAFLLAQKAEDEAMNQEIYQMFMGYPIGRD